MLSKVITFHDIANNYISMSYGSFEEGSQLTVNSKFGSYQRIWDADEEIVSTVFKSGKYRLIEDEEVIVFNKIISCFKKTVAKMVQQDPKLMELYLMSKATVKKCYDKRDKKGLEQILLWLINNQRR